MPAVVLTPQAGVESVPVGTGAEAAPATQTAVAIAPVADVTPQSATPSVAPAPAAPHTALTYSQAAQAVLAAPRLVPAMVAAPPLLPPAPPPLAWQWTTDRMRVAAAAPRLPAAPARPPPPPLRLPPETSIPRAVAGQVPPSGTADPATPHRRRLSPGRGCAPGANAGNTS